MKMMTMFACLLFAMTAFAADSPDDVAIREVVDRGYVQGVHNDADGEKIRGGMHQSFVMFVRAQDGAVTQLTRDQWIERIEKGKAERKPDAPRPKTTAEITVLDRAGDAAVVRVNLFRDGKQVFTDYISLYRFADGWKMVGKTFHRH